MNQNVLSYLQLIRAPAIFTALSNILAAQLIATQGHIIWSDLLLLLGSSVSMYSAGMALNDWYDYDTDLQHRPDRPLPSGKIPRRNALFAGVLLLLTGVGLAALVSTASFFIAAGIVTLVLLYDGVLKNTGAAGLLMGGCRYLNWLLGFSSLTLTELSFLIPVPVFLYILSLTLLSQQEEIAQKKSTVLVTAGGVWLAGLAVIGLARLQAAGPEYYSLVVVACVACISFYLWLCYRDFTPSSIQKTVGILLLAIIPLDALLVLTFSSWWWALPVLALLLPGKILARKMYIT